MLQTPSVPVGVMQHKECMLTRGTGHFFSGSKSLLSWTGDCETVSVSTHRQINQTQTRNDGTNKESQFGTDEVINRIVRRLAPEESVDG